MTRTVTRRELIRSGVAAGAAVGLYGTAADTLSRALAAQPRCGRLKDIDHVVILLQENRSFDHYFGTHAGVRGFADPSGLFGQPSGTLCGGQLYPFRLNTDPSSNGECTNDI